METTLRYYVDINLMGREIQRMSFEKLTTDPTTDNFVGRIYYNTTNNTIRYCTSIEPVTWITLSSAGNFDALSIALSETNANLDDTNLSVSSIISLLEGADEDTIPSIISAISDLQSIDATTSTNIASISTVLNNVSESTTELSSGLEALETSTSTAIESIATLIDGLDVEGINSVISDISESQVTISETLSDTVAALSLHEGDTTNPHLTTLDQVLEAGNIAARNIDMGGNKITNVATPTSDLDVVNKAYADALVQGLKVRDKAAVIALTNLDATYASGGDSTGLNDTLTSTADGALVIDEYTLSVGQRVIIANQTNKVHNGIYKVTVAGGASAAWVLTRDGEYDDSPSAELLAGDYFFIQYGEKYGASGWVVKATTAKTDPVIGTDPILFSQFSAANSYIAGHAVDIDGNIIKVVVEDLVGTGLETDGSTLSVKGYTPVEGSTVARKVTDNNVTITANEVVTFTHNLGTKGVSITIIDNAYDEEVIVKVKANTNNTITIESVISFTATVIVIG
jgi:hypothetical protein